MTTSSIQSQGNEPLVALIDQLQAIVESLIEVGVLVHDNQGTQQSHQVLTHKFNQIISQLSGITSSPYTNQFPIPVDIINYIEDGRNPDIYTREFIEVNAKSNARLKGKMQNFGRLRDVLSDKLIQEFPDMENTLTDIKGRTSTPKEDV